MVEITGHNITCALGNDTETTFHAIESGRCGITFHDASSIRVAENLMASSIDESTITDSIYAESTRLEHIALHSINDAINQGNVIIDPNHTVLILSSTKGNIRIIEDNTISDKSQIDRVALPLMAKYLSTRIGLLTKPIVVSNACISGLAALILAQRMLETRKFDMAIVIGADELSRFTVSGFQSFKALSPNCCKPFDAARNGLNLGEAAATMIVKYTPQTTPGKWYIEKGSINNDANHISGPSRVGEGSYRALCSVTKGIVNSDIAVINTHGTATLYNDEMESIAIDRAGLSNVNINAYKGYLGHTLGAAGILESILSIKSIDNCKILSTMGYENCGVSRELNIVKKTIHTNSKIFIKLLSGFGGCNAAARFRKEDEE